MFSRFLFCFCLLTIGIATGLTISRAYATEAYKQGQIDAMKRSVMQLSVADESLINLKEKK